MTCNLHFLYCWLQQGVFEDAVHLEELNILLGRRYEVIHKTGYYLEVLETYIYCVILVLVFMIYIFIVD